MQEIWTKLGVKLTMSTAHHPQTDGETERVNQELEQYFCIFCNFEQDNWTKLVPFMEFAHNARQHSATGKSPFAIWYGFQPDLIQSHSSTEGGCQSHEASPCLHANTQI